MSAKKSTAPAIAWRYVGPGYFPGVPQHDLTQAQFDALPILRQQDVVDGTVYEQVPTPGPITLDPLGELTDDAYESLSAGEKGARTRKANEQRQEAEEAARTAGEQQTGNAGEKGE